MDRLIGHGFRFIFLDVLNGWIGCKELGNLASAATSEQNSVRQIFLSLIASDSVKHKSCSLQSGMWLLTRSIFVTNLFVDEANVRRWRLCFQKLLYEKRCNNLRKLHLHFNKQGCKIKYWDRLLFELPCLEELKIFNLAYDGNFNDKNTHYLPTPMIRPLEVVSFKGCDMSFTEDLRPIISSAKRLRLDACCSHLSNVASSCGFMLFELTIEGSASTVSNSSIVRLTHKCRGLQVLDLSDHRLVNNKVLLSVAKNCLDIQCISFTHSHAITTDGVEKALPRMKNLTRLSVFCPSNSAVRGMLMVRPDVVFASVCDVLRAAEESKLEEQKQRQQEHQRKQSEQERKQRKLAMQRRKRM